jgi:hypothetical protein
MKSELKTYTTEEINSNINKLTVIQDGLKLERSELTRRIGQLKKQIDYWEELPKNQIKLF